MKLSGMELRFYVEPRRACAVSFAPRVLADTPRHCVLLHGWNCHSSYLMPLLEALRAREEARHHTFWLLDFPTHFRPFDDAARGVSRVLAAQNTDWRDTIFLGYSMGGVVARRLIADGFPCRALVTICAPHDGPARWVPRVTAGPRSLGKRSPQMRALNADARDTLRRRDYHFFALTYRDRLGFHDDDAVVPRASALGEHLGEVGTRRVVTVDYGRALGRSFKNNPHVEGLNPRTMQPAIELCARLFAEGEKNEPL